MRSKFYKPIFLLAISLFTMLIGYSQQQQKQRPSERPYQQELAKFRKMQEQRNALIQRMGNRNDMSNRLSNGNRPVSSTSQAGAAPQRPALHQKPGNKQATN